MLFGGILGAIVQAFFPGPWAFFYQAPIALAVVYLVAKQQARQSVEQPALLTFAGICAGGGALLFALLGLLPSILTLLMAGVGMWMGVSLALDRYLGTDMESSQRITGLICGPIWLIWLIVGAGFILLHGLV